MFCGKNNLISSFGNINPNSSSKRKLTNETESALVKVDETLNDQLIRINITKR